MSRQFRLGGLLRLRQSQEELAAAELARANAVRDAAARRRRDSAEMLAGATMPEIADAAVWQASVAARAALGGMYLESVAALTAAQAATDAAAQDWTRARVRATTLEKLEDRHAVAVRLADEHAEQLALDETAGRRRTGALTTTTTLEGDR